MSRLNLCTLAVMLALVILSEASWRPRSQPQDTPWDPMASRGLQGPAPAHRRQLGPQGPPQFGTDLSNKRGPSTEEEEVYGWMDFGRRSAEDPDQHP